jgi:hypothetical protein
MPKSPYTHVMPDNINPEKDLPPTPPDAREAAKAALHKIRSCCCSVHDERNLVDRLAIEALAVIDSLPDAEQLPCCKCGEKHPEFTIENADWNTIVRGAAAQLAQMRAERGAAILAYNEKANVFNSTTIERDRSLVENKRIAAERDALRKEVEEAKRQYAKALVRPDELVEECDRIKSQFLEMNDQIDALTQQRDEARAALDFTKDLMRKAAEQADKDHASYTRKLRNEIRVLWQRLRDANRGAESNAKVSWGLAKDLAAKDVELVKAQAALTAAQQDAREDGEAWQPIATAPKPEEPGRIVWQRILAYHESWQMPVVLKWSPQRPSPHWTTDAGEVVNVAPTHWMPLPKPPAAIRAAREGQAKSPLDSPDKP